MAEDAPGTSAGLTALLAEVCAFFDDYAPLYDFSNVRIVNERRLDGMPAEWRAWLAAHYTEDQDFSVLKALLAGRGEEAGEEVPGSLRAFCERRLALLQRCRGFIPLAVPPQALMEAEGGAGDAGSEGDANSGRAEDLIAHMVEAAGGLEREVEGDTGAAWEGVVACAHARLPKGLNTQSVNLRMRPKKIHEVNRMAAFIAAKCAERGITHVIDIGGGVGHLCRALKTLYGLNVTVLEGDAKICETAVRDFGMKAINMFITQETWDDVVRVIAEVADRVAIVGLHCCGDLSVTILRLYAALRESAKLLCLVPCCYHKMKLVETNVPLSAALRMHCAGQAAHGGRPAPPPPPAADDPYAKPEEFCRIAATQSPFLLRLAAQEAFLQWDGMDAEGHLQHSRAFGYRAVLEDVVRREPVTMKKRKRHTQHTGPQMALPEAEGFPRWVAENFDLQYKPGAGKDGEEPLPDLLRRYVAEHAACFPVLEGISGLQQSVRELALCWMVLDRLLYLSEQVTVGTVAVYNLFDEKLSAMNKVLVGTRA